MAGQIPADAFQSYLALGGARSYSTLAQQLGVSKQAIVKRAAKEKWQERVAEIEAKARAQGDQQAVETLHELNSRLMKLWKLVETRATQALRDHPIDSGMDGVKALDLATKNIRLIQGEPTDRVESIEAIIRRETQMLLTTEPEDDWSDAEERGPDDAGLASAG